MSKSTTPPESSSSSTEPAGTVYEPTTIVSPGELEMADSARIDSFCIINATGGLILGEESCIHAGSHVIGSDALELGDRSVVTYNAVLLTSSADLRYPSSSVVPADERESINGEISIGQEAFIGSTAVIAPGVTIGDGAVVGAGSYVDEDVPDGMIYYPNGRVRDRPDGRWQRSVES